jgi:hypothetical protein
MADNLNIQDTPIYALAGANTNITSLRLANGSDTEVAVGSVTLGGNTGMYFDTGGGGERILFMSNGTLALYLDGANVYAGNAFLAAVVNASFQTQTAGLVAGITTKIAAYTATASDHTILCNATGGAFTITLPAASNTGLVFVIKKTDASGNAVTVDGAGAETIDGAATVSLSAQWASIMIQSNGANWLILAEHN